MPHSLDIHVFSNLDLSAIVDNLKEAHQSALLASDGSTVNCHNSLQLEYMCAAYLPLFRAVRAEG